jgi:hypothetical protein
MAALNQAKVIELLNASLISIGFLPFEKHYILISLLEIILTCGTTSYSYLGLLRLLYYLISIVLSQNFFVPFS